MDYTRDGKDLIITVDEDEQARIREQVDEGDFSELELFEDLIANSELQWISSDDTGDLIGNDAPMLGVWGEAVPGEEGDGVLAGCYSPEGGGEPVPHYHPIVERWAFMDYAVRMVWDDLLSDGKVVFQGA